MISTTDLGWLESGDLEILRSLTDQATAPTSIRARENAGTRLAIAATAPVWLGLTGVIVIARSLVGRTVPRPSLLLHQRIGHQGRALWVPKIPTMVVPQNRSVMRGIIDLASGPPVEGHVATALDAWLRTSGLDELPQLALVVTGHMRLIGPRPVTPNELDEMREHGPIAIDQMAPGLLGVWQLLDRSAYSLNERRQLDHWMLERWSPSMRRRIMATGVRQALRRIARR